MRILVIALLAALLGGAAIWLYGHVMTDRDDQATTSELQRLTEDYVAAINAGDRDRLEQLTVGQANYDLTYDIGQPRPSFVGSPFVAIMLSAVQRWGPARIEAFTVEAVGEAVSTGHLRTSFADRRYPDQRAYLTNTNAQLLFEKLDGVWRISGTVL